MDVRFTSVVGEGVAEQVRDVTSTLQDELKGRLSDGYGSQIDLLCVVVSVSDDPDENARFARPHAKLGHYKPWPGEEKRRLWSNALTFPQSAFGKQSSEQMRRSIIEGLAESLSRKPARLPASFDYDAFLHDATTGLGAMLSAA